MNLCSKKLIGWIDLIFLFELACFVMVLCIYAEHHNYSSIETIITSFGAGYFVLNRRGR